MPLSKIQLSQAAGRRNLVINGGMQVAQRATSKTAITTPNYYTIDRQQTEINNAGTWTMTQSTDVPAGEGFSKSLKYDCTTADASLGTSHYFIHRHSFEGQDLQRLMYGTSNAKPATISFFVKSNKTGTYVCELQQLATDGSYPRSGKAFTINSANTWERKVITINGNTAKFIPNSNARGMDIMIWMAAGTDYTSGTFNAGNSWTTTNNERAGALTVNIADSTSNEIYFTGLQMEVGDSATDFEHRLFGEELSLCQRYYQTFQNGQLVGTRNTGTRLRIGAATRVDMRANPTVGRPAGTTVAFQDDGSSKTSTNTSPAQASTATPKYMYMDLGGFTGVTNRTYGGAANYAGTTVFTADAEI